MKTWHDRLKDCSVELIRQRIVVQKANLAIMERDIDMMEGVLKEKLMCLLTKEEGAIT